MVRSWTWSSKVGEGLEGSSSCDGSGGDKGWVDDCPTSLLEPSHFPNLDW